MAHKYRKGYSSAKGGGGGRGAVNGPLQVQVGETLLKVIASGLCKEKINIGVGLA